jgi:hypothetical protein
MRYLIVGLRFIACISALAPLKARWLTESSAAQEPRLLNVDFWRLCFFFLVFGARLDLDMRRVALTKLRRRFAQPCKRGTIPGARQGQFDPGHSAHLARRSLQIRS